MMETDAALHRADVNDQSAAVTG